MSETPTDVSSSHASQIERTGFFDPEFVKYYEQTDNTRQVDREFYLELARCSEGPVLDAGCGSGRIMIPLLESGIEVHGFDNSPVMLEALTSKLTRRDLSAPVWEDHLESFTCEAGQYGLVICSFNTMLHLMDHDAQRRALARVYEALRPGGTFAFDLTNPFNFDIFSRRAIGKTFEATLYDSATDTETTIWRWFERDLIQQTGTYHREYELQGPNGPTSHETTVSFRWTYPSEMDLLLEVAGFRDRAVYGDFAGEPLDEESEMQVWVVKK